MFHASVFSIKKCFFLQNAYECPNGVEISQLNRCLTYAYGYGNFELARENYEALPEEWRVEACRNCEECEVQCVHGLNLTHCVHLALELFT